MMSTIEHHGKNQHRQSRWHKLFGWSARVEETESDERIWTERETICLNYEIYQIPSTKCNVIFVNLFY